MNGRHWTALAVASVCAPGSGSIFADPGDDRSSDCRNLPDQAVLKAALKQARTSASGGFNLEMWGAVVNRDGIVCATASTGDQRGDQWPGSRVVAAQKANTGNAFSLPGLALSTARGEIVGGLGVSGDSSCADHNIGWKTRHLLVLDDVPAGVSGDASRPDNIVYDIVPQAGQQEGTSAAGSGHPRCSAAATAIAATLPPARH